MSTTQPRTAYLRQQIRRMCDRHGDCLNTWPRRLQLKYSRYARELRQLENGVAGYRTTDPETEATS